MTLKTIEPLSWNQNAHLRQKLPQTITGLTIQHQTTVFMPTQDNQLRRKTLELDADVKLLVHVNHDYQFAVVRRRAFPVAHHLVNEGPIRPDKRMTSWKTSSTL